MLYELRADTGASRLVTAPAPKRTERMPACLRVWAGETWLPGLRAATYCEVWRVEPLALYEGYPWIKPRGGGLELLGHIGIVLEEMPAPEHPRLAFADV